MPVQWIYRQGNWLLVPRQPRGLIHFLGGAFVAGAPQLTYGDFLQKLALQGFGIIATPFLVQPDHYAIARDVTQMFRAGWDYLKQEHHCSSLPVFGIGHSLGAKLQLLLTCQQALPRHGNILISFNNFDSDRAIPFAQALPSFVPLTFSPTPEETLARIQAEYTLSQTLVLRFQMDTLDESSRLIPLFESKFPQTFMHQTMGGDHLTPLEPNLSPTQYRSRLDKITLKWLNYQHGLICSTR